MQTVSFNTSLLKTVGGNNSNTAWEWWSSVFLCIYSAMMCQLSKNITTFEDKCATFNSKAQTELMSYRTKSIQFGVRVAICSSPTAHSRGGINCKNLPLSTALLHKKSEENTAWFSAWFSQYERTAGLPSWDWLKGFPELEDSWSCWSMDW